MASQRLDNHLVFGAAVLWHLLSKLEWGIELIGDLSPFLPLNHMFLYLLHNVKKGAFHRLNLEKEVSIHRVDVQLKALTLLWRFGFAGSRYRGLGTVTK